MKVAAQVRDFDPAAHFDENRLRLLDRIAQLALVAAREAVAQSGIDFRTGDLAPRTASVIGTGVGGELARDEQCRKLYRDNSPRVHPLTIVRIMPNAPASHVSIEFGATRPGLRRGQRLRLGQPRASSRPPPWCAAAWPMSPWPAAPRPASAWPACAPGKPCAWSPTTPAGRSAAAPRPGAGRRRRHVRARGARACARARRARSWPNSPACGMSADAGDIVAPSGDGAARAMRAALDDAGLAPQQSTTSTPTAPARRPTTPPRPRPSAGVRRACRRACGVLDQGRARPCAGRRRRAGTGGRDRRAARRRDAADGEFPRSRPRMRPRLRAQRRARSSAWTRRCPTPSPSAASTRCWRCGAPGSEPLPGPQKTTPRRERRGGPSSGFRPTSACGRSAAALGLGQQLVQQRDAQVDLLGG